MANPEYKEQILITKDQIDRRSDELAVWINTEYRGKQLLLVPILMGAMPTVSKLMARIDLPDMEIDGIRVKSYKGETSEDEPRLVWDLITDIKGRNVLVVDDIADTRKTLQFVRQTMAKRNPATLRFLTFLDKPERKQVDVDIDQVGFVIKNVWVEHFGLDTDGLNRNGENITYRVF